MKLIVEFQETRFIELDLTNEQAELFKSFPEGRNQSISDECAVFYNGDYVSNEINELVENLLSYKVYDAEKKEFASGSLATDGTITEETAIENVFSSLGVIALETE